MTVPNKQEVIQAIRDNAPKELLDQVIWLAYYFRENQDGSYSKPPVRGYSVAADQPSFSFEEVIQDGYPGIKLNPQNIYVAVDVDDKEAKRGNVPFTYERIPEKFRLWLEAENSYTEISPSGCGIRTLFKVRSKDGLPGRVNLNAELCLGGELFINTGYVTLTGNYLFGNGIKEIDANELLPWYSKNGQPSADTSPPPTPQPMPEMPPSVPKLKEVIAALDCCRLDQSTIIKKSYTAVTGEDYNHYEYWIKILSACHHYTTVAGKYEEQLLAHVIEWSKTDEDAFQSEDDVITHWASFTENPGSNIVTYNTLFKFARLTRFEWPKEKMYKGDPTGKPRVNEYSNFVYLMEYYDFSVYHEPYTNSFYVSGDEKILTQYFTGEKLSQFFGKVGPLDIDDLSGRLWCVAQDNHYDNVAFSSISQIVRIYVNRSVKTFNLMEQWLSTPYEELPKDLKEPGTDTLCSNIDYLLSCIKFSSDQNLELAEIYLQAFFFGIVMPIYNTDRKWAEHNFMLILTGPENCRKTSFFSSLFPENFVDYLLTHSTETLSSSKSLRDFMIQLSSAALVVVDEFEIFYSPQNDSLFKTLVTSKSVEYVPIYSKTMKKAVRTAALAGTTNKEKLPIEQDSSRRLALVSVKFIDTDALKKINWHYFYNHYVKKGKILLQNQKYPWKLSQAQINLQYQENEKYRSRNDLEIVLREAFDFDIPFDGLHTIKRIQGPYEDSRILYTRKDIQGVLLQKSPTMRIKPSALSNVLERLCGRYTSTMNRRVDLTACKGTVRNGVAQQKQFKRYIMPPVITDFVPERDMEENDD